jgi:hypothetical protein
MDLHERTLKNLENVRTHKILSQTCLAIEQFHRQCLDDSYKG